MLAALAACGGNAPFTPAAATRDSAVDLRRAIAPPVNVVENPGFESGLAHWRICGKLGAVIAGVAHSGVKSARLGTVKKPEIDGEAAICQSFIVPSGARLTFWVKSAADVSSSFAWQRAQLLSPGGRPLQTLYTTASNSRGWKKFGYDLSAYAGKVVTIQFAVRGTGAAGGYIGQYVDDVSVAGAASPSPSPSPTASAMPTSSPTSTPTAAPTGSPASSPTPTSSPGTSSCLQPQASAQPSSVLVVAFASVTSAIASAHQVCLSAYVFTSAMYSALDAAARSGAKVTLVLPNEERSSDSGDATQLSNDGATIVWDPGSPTDHPLHAKLAIVDGVAYLDGRNWDTSDVTIADGVPADFVAIENALNLNPTSSANLDTVKSLAVAREDAFITGAAPGAGVTVQFMSESFGSDANTVTALENAATNGATVQVIVLGSDESENSTEENALAAMKTDGVQIRLNPSSGSEKMTLISGQSTAWFGSANATYSGSLSYDYIDWGMTVTNPSVIASLQSYFTSTWNGSTPY